VRAASAAVMQQYPTLLRRPMRTTCTNSRVHPTHSLPQHLALPQRSLARQPANRTPHLALIHIIEAGPPALVLSSPHLSTQHHPACLLRRLHQRVAPSQKSDRSLSDACCILLSYCSHLSHIFACFPLFGRSRHPDYRKEQSTPPVPRLHRYFATRAHHGLHFVQQFTLHARFYGFSQTIVDTQLRRPKTIHILL
jgi:hypothetical protein